MVIKFTKRERATVLAALHRWLSYPAAREADSIATTEGKHRPLDNGEIDRLYKRIAEWETKESATHILRGKKNGAPTRKGLKLGDDAVREQRHRFGPNYKNNRRNFGLRCS